jgi:hypothetical protein
LAGQVIPIGFRALDATGTPYPNARIYTFDSAATTTPKATYTTDALSVSHGAYIEGDAGGNFPQAWASEGAGFYLELRTAAGLVIKTWDDVVALGVESTGAITRDFGVDGRLRIRGDSGKVFIEAGQPTGDDTGGDLEISGYGGTQADTIVIDGAVVTVTGQLIGKGTATDDSAAAGYLGEIQASQLVLGTAVGLTTNVAADIAPALALTPGDWDVSANVIFNVGAADTMTVWQAWLNTVSATAPTPPGGGHQVGRGSVAGAQALGATLAIPPQRFSVNASTIVYLSGVATHSGGVLLAYGALRARRVR